MTDRYFRHVADTQANALQAPLETAGHLSGPAKVTADRAVGPRTLHAGHNWPFWSPGSGCRNLCRDDREAEPVESADLINRDEERRALDLLVNAAKQGHSGSLVLRGEPGIGKTKLLDYAVNRASGMRLARVTAIESEMELGFAAVHQLLIPFLPALSHLPVPQREALSSALGLAGDAAPDRFMVGLAVLTLLAGAASERPLLVVVDDAQWLDQVSAEVLAFVARRVYADSIVFLFAVREPAERRMALGGLTEVRVPGLADGAARDLLASVAEGPLDNAVGARIVAETGGNPLALMELSAELTEGQLTGSSVLPEPLPVGSRLQQRFLRQVRALPAETQALLLLAAADPSGNADLLWRAAGGLGLTVSAAAPAETQRLLTVAPRVEFRHPLIRSAVYHGAPVTRRRQAHRALAAATDPQLDADRRAWHLAGAAAAPDEQVAAELERCAERARRRGGFAASAAFLARAAELTPDPGERPARRLAAAADELAAGTPGRAQALLEQATPELRGPLERAMAQRLEGTIRVTLGQGHETLPVMLAAAQALVPLDLRLGRDALLEAMEAAIFFRRPGSIEEPRLIALSAGEATAAPGFDQTTADLLLDGYTARFTDGYRAAVPHFRRAVTALRAGGDIRWFMLGCLAAGELWDLHAWHALATRWVQLCRENGALTTLPIALQLLAGAEVAAGRLSAIDPINAEAAEISAATGNPGLIGTEGRGQELMSAWRGRAQDTRAAVEAHKRELIERGQGGGFVVGQYALTVLEIGLGHFQAALPHAMRVYHDDIFFGCFVLPEVVEAATRAGDHEAAAAALDRLTERATASGTTWALGLLARSQALVAGEDTAEERYREAIDHLRTSRARPDLARAHLLYGEWLRRRRRRSDARAQLRTALDIFHESDMRAFAERAGNELRASGERAGRVTQESRDRSGAREVLTPQEERIARLVAEGASNPDVAAQLFLSSSTVEYHLRKVFRKLGVFSRVQLSSALRAQEDLIGPRAEAPD
jgi:DNA-binding CsgD family transcriptional regulator